MSGPAGNASARLANGRHAKRIGETNYARSDISQSNNGTESSLANFEIEKAVLGSLISGGRALIDKVGVENIDPNLFVHSPSCRILAAIAELYDEGAPFDLQVVTERLRQQGNLAVAGGAAAITALGVDGNPDADIARFYLGELRALYAKRQAARIADRLKRGDIDIEDARAELENIVTRSREQEKPLIEFRSPLQLKNFTPPPGLVLVGDSHIVKGSVFIFGGAPGVGKSRAAVGLAVAGATAHDWFGLQVHRRFKTMIIQTENGEFRLAREFAELDCNALDDFVRICPPPPYGLCFEQHGFRQQLTAAIAEFKPDIVIFDPWNAAARDEKAREYLETFNDLRSVLPLGDDAPALGIVAHTRKPKTDERASGRALLNLLAGSYVLGSVPRTVFVMQAASDDTTDNQVVWTCCKNNDGELGARSAWERRNGLFTPVIDFDWDAFDALKGDNRELITEADVRAVFAKGTLTKAEAAKQLESDTGAHRTTCYRALELDGRFGKHLCTDGEKISWK